MPTTRNSNCIFLLLICIALFWNRQLLQSGILSIMNSSAEIQNGRPGTPLSGTVRGGAATADLLEKGNSFAKTDANRLRPGAPHRPRLLLGVASPPWANLSRNAFRETVGKCIDDATHLGPTSIKVVFFTDSNSELGTDKHGASLIEMMKKENKESWRTVAEALCWRVQGRRSNV